MADSSSDTVLLLLRSLELRILRCSLSPTCSAEQTSTSTLSHQNLYLRLAEELVILIEKGDYVGALSISELGQLTSFEFSNSWNFDDDDDDDSIGGAERFYFELNKNLDAFLLPHESNSSPRAFLLFCVGVAAFLAFTKNNLTGPFVSSPSFPFVFMRGKENNGMEKWDVWARKQLMSTTGSALRGKFSLLQYIVYAKMLFTKVKDFFVEGSSDSFTGLRSISLWLSRLILLQQRLSEEHTSSLYESLQVLMTENLNHFGKVESIESYWGTWLHEGEPLSIVSMLNLESGIIEHIFGRVDQARKYFDTAEEASGLQVSLTGVLGVRTLDQVDAVSQRVLVANTVTPPIGGIGPRRSCELQTSASKLGEDNLGLGYDEIHNTSNVLMVPKLLENKKDCGNGDNGVQNGEDTFISLVGIQQAVILSRCLIIEKIACDDEMQRWDMAPFIEAVDAQKSSYFIIQCFCNILRIRWEFSRNRTKERALLMMEKLVQSVYESFPSVVQRIPCSFGVYFPTIPALRKEFGELLVRCGMIGDALKVFEDLELWDNLINCYCLLEKKAVAIELIKARLCELPNDPRLWCSLGDVTNIDSYYEKALEVSNNRSARAKRALARSAYNRGDYETSKTLWESAMALNSLFPDGWFALGAAALKALDMEKALEGFQRAVQLDPDNGEAWNNLACVHMIKKKNKEAFISFTEALKFRRNNWKMWENYAKVAVNIGNFQQALEATVRVLGMTNNKRVDAELLEAIMIEIESRISKQNPYHAASGDPNCSLPNHLCTSFGDSTDEPIDKDHILSWSRETKHLVELLGKVLQQCIHSGIGEDIWGVYARWHKIKGDFTMCSEALLKQVRSYQGADLWNNQDRFKKFARASLQLCKAYMDISLSTGSRRELNAAEMHLRNTVKQAVNFVELEEFKALQYCLEEVRKRLHATSVPSVENP